MSETKGVDRIPEEFAGEVSKGTREFIDRGIDDPRWDFSIDRIDNGPSEGLWLIGWRGSGAFPMFPLNPEWSRIDYYKAVDEFLHSPGWGQMAWVVTRNRIIDRYELKPG